MKTAAVSAPPAMGSHASHRSLRPAARAHRGAAQLIRQAGLVAAEVSVLTGMCTWAWDACAVGTPSLRRLLILTQLQVHMEVNRASCLIGREGGMAGVRSRDGGGPDMRRLGRSWTGRGRGRVRRARRARLRRCGRNRNEGKRPQMKPPACDTCDVPAGVVATVTMKNARNASIISPRIIGLRRAGAFSRAPA